MTLRSLPDIGAPEHQFQLIGYDSLFHFKYAESRRINLESPTNILGVFFPNWNRPAGDVSEI